MAITCDRRINGAFSKDQWKPLVLATKDIAMFSGLQQNFDISKSREEPGFNQKKAEIAAKEALDYLIQRKIVKRRVGGATLTPGFCMY